LRQKGDLRMNFLICALSSVSRSVWIVQSAIVHLMSVNQVFLPISALTAPAHSQNVVVGHFWTMPEMVINLDPGKVHEINFF